MFRRTFTVIVIAIVLCASFVRVQSRVAAQGPEPATTDAPQSPLGTAFTYQGQLKKNGAPVTDNCLMAFRLYDQASGGNQIGSPISTTVPITNGLFTVALDFGSAPFAGEARWLGITVRCTADSAYIDLDRQSITAAPYALYSTSTGALQGRSVANTNPVTNQVLKWNGSTWSPADDAIGPPGSGDISAVIAGNGLSGGGTTGDVTLTVAFAGSGVANTVARSDHTHSGVYSLIGHTHSGSDITSPVANATNADLLDGQHASAFAAVTHHHLGQTWQGNNNPLIITGTFGAPNYAPLVLGNTDLGGDGLRIIASGGDGVDVRAAGDDGVQVYSAGKDGMYVESAGDDGVRVGSAGDDGVHVGSAGDNGVYVTSAGSDGIHVYEAGADGVYVRSAGNPSVTSSSAYSNGLEIAGAEGSGLYVGHADLDGVTVHSADWYGVYVEQADEDGVRVQSAGRNGVMGISVNAMYYGGFFRNDVAGGAGLYAAGGDNTAPDLVLGVYGSGDDGRIYSQPDLTSSDILLFSNDEAHIHLDEDANSDSTFTIYNGANASVFSVNEAGIVTFAGAAATQVEAGTYGSRTVYAVQSTGNWYEDFGAAQLVNGQATVTIEPIFAQTVNLSETYHVFLTPLGDCALYVAEKTPTSFTVKAMGGQTCSIAFDYRIVAKRLGYETLRLEPATSVETGGEE